MEVICIESHPDPEGVQAPNSYTLIGVLAAKQRCNCEELFNVGFMLGSNITNLPLDAPIRCSDCHQIYYKKPEDNYWWFRASRFAMVSSEEELNRYHQKKPQTI
jgi:hypothetical protein